MTWYPYQSVSGRSEVPLAPILPVTLVNSERNDGRTYELDAFLDTGADVTLIPLEVVSVLRLPFLNDRVSVTGVGGAVTNGFPCQVDLQFGELQLPLLEVVSCEAFRIGRPRQMIIGRDILNQFCVRFDGKRSRFFLSRIELMSREPRCSKEAFARRGHEIYEPAVRSQVEAGNDGRIVAIDIETGAFEVADDSLTAAKLLLKRCPDAQIFGIRIGRRACFSLR